MPTPWLAPAAQAPVVGEVRLPGSKSHTARALVLAALADGPATVRAPLHARDTDLMAAGLRGLGTQITDQPDGSWQVIPSSLHQTSVDVGLAGTVMRFLPPVAALASGDVSFDGDAYARKRPQAVLIDGLRQAGAWIDAAPGDRLPMTVHGRRSLSGGRVSIDASASSQFVSGLLLAGARYEKGIEVAHVGRQAVPSAAHLAMTVQALAGCGVHVDTSRPRVWSVAPGPIRARDVDIEPDLSTAAPFLAAAVLTAGTVRVPDWPADSHQPGDRLRELLTEVGAEVDMRAGILTVRGTAAVRGLDVDLHDIGELTPVLAAVLAFADGPSRLRGIAHLRGHETDRLAGLCAGLTALGGQVEQTPDGLLIQPKPLHAARWHSYADHRMAQAGAVLGLLVAGLTVDDIACTRKTMPDFVHRWSALINPAG